MDRTLYGTKCLLMWQLSFWGRLCHRLLSQLSQLLRSWASSSFRLIKFYCMGKSCKGFIWHLSGIKFFEITFQVACILKTWLMSRRVVFKLKLKHLINKTSWRVNYSCAFTRRNQFWRHLTVHSRNPSRSFWGWGMSPINNLAIGF